MMTGETRSIFEAQRPIKVPGRGTGRVFMLLWGAELYLAPDRSEERYIISIRLAVPLEPATALVDVLCPPRTTEEEAVRCALKLFDEKLAVAERDGFEGLAALALA